MEALFVLFGLFLLALMLLVGLALLIATLQGLVLAFRTSLLFGAVCLLVPIVPFIVFAIVFWVTGVDLPERILAAFREPSSSNGNTPPAPVHASVPSPVPAVPSTDPITLPTTIPVGPSDPVSKIASYPAVVTEGDVVLAAPVGADTDTNPAISVVEPVVEVTLEPVVLSNCNGTGGVDEDEEALPTAPSTPAAPGLVQPPVKALAEPANAGH
ncbi:MAG: hypothetical protein IAF58_17715 [Leptolyngbya sp.]|nr:hypothetical protein [Candidatus Melainabacteria bacterium]